jgi:hypothetical protein
MSKVDWSKAPEGAEFYDSDEWPLWYKIDDGKVFFFSEKECWIPSAFDVSDIREEKGFYRRPKEWPTEERIDNIGRNRTDDDLGHYNRNADEALGKNLNVYSEESKKPKSGSKIPFGNKYDREIVGKYNTGVCVVDVYRVLDAYKTGNAAIDHAIKKLLCAGERGAKDQKQDWLEAIQSIEQALRLEDDRGQTTSAENKG